MLDLTIKRMIEDALPFAGLASSPIQNDVLQIALGTVNFEGQMLWDRWPFDAEKAVVDVKVDEYGVATFPPEVDVIRAIRILEDIGLDTNSTDLLDSIAFSYHSNIVNLSLFDVNEGKPAFGSPMSLTVAFIDGEWKAQEGIAPGQFWTNPSTGQYPPKDDNWSIGSEGADPCSVSYNHPQIDDEGNVIPYTTGVDNGEPLFSRDEIESILVGEDVASGEFHYMSDSETGTRRIQLSLELANTYIRALVLQHFVPYTIDDYATRTFPIDRAETVLKAELIDGIREFMGMEKIGKGNKAFGIAVAREDKQQQKVTRLVPRHPTFSMDD